MSAECHRNAAIPFLLLWGFIGQADAQNIPAFSKWTNSALADPLQFKPKTACTALVSQTNYEFSITTAVTVPAAADVPEHCRVTGLIQPDVQFEVRLPLLWNGRIYMIGNGGYAGEQLDAPARVAGTQAAVARGFATAQTNTGHEAAVEPLATFAVSRQKFLDYAFRAVHITAVAAKRLVQVHYGVPPRRSYFNGCSTGGRQGLISAQRFPDDFDGIVVGSPVLNFSATMIGYVHNQRALAKAHISPDKIKTLAAAIYSKCDAVDGVKDGVIDDPRRCAFKPSSDLPRCGAEAGNACFTEEEIIALEAIYGGVNRNGAAFFPGWPVGSEIGVATQTSAWIPWFVTLPGQTPVQKNFGETFFRYMAFGRPNPSYDWLTFDLTSDYDKLAPTRVALDATDPDLSRFRARGGKIVSYYG